MKKFFSLIVCLMFILSLTACGTSKTAVDFTSITDFESALNNGEDVTDKTVTLSVDKLVPDSAFGYNIQAGEHLNFCSAKNPGVDEGDMITVKVTSVTSMLGSYIIEYEMVDKDVSVKDSLGGGNENEIDAELLPLEVKEFGYSMNGEYLYYSVKIYNPNNDKAVEFPKFRVTARNEAGEVLATQEQTLSIIYPLQEFVFASQAFDTDEIPTKVDIEIIEPDDYNIKKVSSLDNPEYIPLKAVSTALRSDSVTGEIQNDNDYDLDMAVVTVVFRDEVGNMIGGTSTYIDPLKANSSTPFDMYLYIGFASENYEVYANIW